MLVEGDPVELDVSASVLVDGDPVELDTMPDLFMQISLFSIAIGIVVLLLSLKTRKWEKLADRGKDKAAQHA